MPLNTKINTSTPAREKFKTEETLLSHGYACPEAFPDGKITIYPWDNSVDEWVRRNGKKTQTPRMFVLELFKRLCDLKMCPYEKFVLGDVSTVILVSRSLRHNNKVVYRPTCPLCAVENQEEMIEVPNELKRIGEKTADYPGFDVVTLPICTDEVKLRPLIVNDEIILENRSKEQKQKVSEEMAHILAPVMDVGGGTPDSLEELLKWYNALHPEDQSYLEDAIDNLAPHLSPNVDHVCDNCGKQFIFTLPLQDKEFFR